MAGMIERERSAAKVALRKAGTEATVFSPTEGAENAYNRHSDSDKTYTNEGTEYAYRVFGSETERMDRKAATGGSIDRESPVIAFGYDSPVDEGWKVQFPDGNKYHLTVEIPSRSQKEFRAELITK